MIDSRNLPSFTFIAPDGSEKTVDLSDQGQTIQAMAAHLVGKGGEGVKGRIVGLVGKSEFDLVIAWLAALVAGFRPLILQYPTKKQSLVARQPG